MRAALHEHDVGEGAHQLRHAREAQLLVAQIFAVHLLSQQQHSGVTSEEQAQRDVSNTLRCQQHSDFSSTE